MSNLVKAVEAKKLKERLVYPPLFLDMVSINESYINVTYGREYSIMATFGSKCTISDEMSEREHALPYAIARTKRAIVEAVFGEFRQDFRLVEEAIWNNNIPKAHKLLREFETRMFSDE